jgi:hypothetical protein
MLTGKCEGFYTRKVKYTQETFCEKLSAILEGFPRLQDIHPFRMSTLIVQRKLSVILSQKHTVYVVLWKLTTYRQGPSEHPLRCGPLPHSPWAARHRETSHRDRLSGLCTPSEICTIALPMQATQAGSSRSYGYDMQTLERFARLPRTGSTTSRSSSIHRPQYSDTLNLRISERWKVQLLAERNTG